MLASAGSLHAEQAAAPAPAAPAASAGTNEVEELIVTGTREVGTKAADSAAPIELVGHAELLRTGSTDLASALTVAVPSLTVSTNGGDAAAVQVLAALRGLSPNDTLVLVDGKRRHTTSNLAVDGGSTYSGSATTDLSFIPVDAIDHIEVLTDGAAAQYGSDAIAGVVNIILKKNTSGGLLDLTGGEYYDGQGQSGAVSINHGFNLGDKGFLNVTLEERYHDFSEVGTGDARFTTATGQLIPGMAYPLSGAAQAANFPNINQLNGDPQYNLYNAFVNAGYDLGDGVQAYGFGSYGYLESQHYENYRSPNKVVGCTSTFTTCDFETQLAETGSPGTYGVDYNVVPFPKGFDPREKFDQRDFSITGGLRGTWEGWHWDLSSTYGGNNTQVYVVDSGNAQLFPYLQAQSATPITPQTTFFNGAFDETEWTNNLDIDRSFALGLAAPVNLAFGVEERRDTYGITAGEPPSYYGAGAQSFDGYLPTDAGHYSRTNVGVYVDVATDPIKHLHIDLAGRFEHYSDFGSTEVGKFTFRYDFTPAIALRGTVSNGFRAPTLAEEHYSGTNVSPYSADVQIPPNSTAAQLAGFSPLKPELSDNYSIGVVLHPMDRLQVTADLYAIDLRNRILASGFIFGTCCGTNAPVISQGVLNAIAARGVNLDSGLSYTGISLFENAASTLTEGLEATANYASDFGDFGHVDWSVGFNWNKTHITHLDPLPADLVNVPFGQTSILTPAATSALTTATPREKVILQALWTWNRFSVNLRETVYGPSSQYTATSNPVLLNIPTTALTDLDIGFKITHWAKVDVGANNLFNHKPPATPIIDGSPADGGYVFSVPEGFAAWNENGGYYYGRVTVTF
jgi:iron complex outermembrane receptor protein